MIISSLAITAFAQAGLSNFQKTLTYTDGKFTDVSSSDWFSTNVKAAYEYGLVNGVSTTSFGAASNVKISEAIALAARLNSIYTTGSASFTEGSPWYQVYVDYAVANEIVAKNRFEDYNVYATRLQVAEIFAAALPSEALTAINNIQNGAIPDVASDYSCEYVYTLYRAGIITGITTAGYFHPADKILRSEISAIATRMVDTSLRVKFTIVPASSGSIETGSITSGAELLAAVKKGYENASLASGYYSNAYHYALLGSTTYTQFDLAKAKECVLTAAAYAKAAAAYCKTNSTYSSAYDNLNNSYLNLTKAAENIAVIYAAPYANSWSATKTLITDSVNAMNSAVTTIDAIV